MSPKPNTVIVSAASAALAKCTDKAQVLGLVANGAVTVEQGLARIEELTPRSYGGKISFKVSEKGALSVYGLQRMPVTLYVEQWERLINAMPELKEFAEKNGASLTRKSAKA